MLAAAPGQFLGPYQIISRVGAGGTSEVYRARDTRLGRDVAIKICADNFSDRFEAEARTIAALNHPNICHLYDIGPNYLVMEFIQGKVLHGPLPSETTIRYACQIADALETAHEQDIIHRDLKPANIMITAGGVPKVLDFGLAKSGEISKHSGDPSSWPTVTTPVTLPGVFIGTAAYMAPEQARGKSVDKRADIWAFGVVLYEMLTGKRLFEAESVAETLAAVLNLEPPLDAAPSQYRPIIARCLKKDPRVRYRDIGDVRIALEEALVPDGRTENIRASSTKMRIAWAAAVLSTLLLTVLAFIHFSQRPADIPAIRSSISSPEGTAFNSAGGFGGGIALSPDGRRLVFSAIAADGKDQLWVRSLDSLTAQPLPGTEGALLPFWSANSRYIGFFADRKLKRVDPSGGPVLVLCDAPIPLGGSWNRDDVIVFAPDAGAGTLKRVSASGGVPVAVTSLDPGRRESLHCWPWFLPDGRHFLYIASGGAGPAVRVASLGASEEKSTLIVPSAYNVAYAQDYLLFMRDSALVAQSFDVKHLITTGQPIPIVSQAPESAGLSDVFSISQNGLLVYRLGAQGGGGRLAWFDRSGKEIGKIGDPGLITNIHLSGDGARCTARIDEGFNADIWIYEITRGIRTRFTFTPADERESVWSPDGTTIVFNSNPEGQFDLFRKSVREAGSEHLLYSDALDKYPNGFSPDGRYLLYESRADPKTKNDLWILPMTGERKPFPFLQTAFNEWRGQFSPDGRWIAYQSDESQRDEIYLAPFPCTASSHCGNQQISTSGGAFPVWARNGKEIFYIAPDNRLMAAEVRVKNAVLEIGAVRLLFGPISQKAPGYRYDVSPDGRRLLAIGAQGQLSPEPLTLLQNWSAGLKK